MHRPSWLLASCILLLLGYIASAQSTSNLKGFSESNLGINATITDAKSGKTEVQAITYHKTASGQSFYRNVESSHEFDWPYIPINTSNFIVKLPLAAIRTLTVEPESRENRVGDQRYRVTALMENGQTSFSGNMIVVTAASETSSNSLGGFGNDDSLVGKTDFGSFRINFENIRVVDFTSHQKPSAAAVKTATPTGHAGSLLLDDGSRLEMKNIFPVANEYNANSVPQGEVRVMQIRLASAGGSETTIMLATLAVIRFLSNNPGYRNPPGTLPELEVESIRGQQLRGVVGRKSADAFGLGGTALFGDDEYEIIVPFTTKAKQLTIRQ